MRGMLRLEMLSLSRREKTRGEEEEREKKEGEMLRSECDRTDYLWSGFPQETAVSVCPCMRMSASISM